MTSVMAGVAKRHAVRTSCPVVLRELFLLPDEDRRLFDGIDKNGNAKGLGGWCVPSRSTAASQVGNGNTFTCKDRYLKGSMRMTVKIAFTQRLLARDFKAT